MKLIEELSKIQNAATVLDDFHTRRDLRLNELPLLDRLWDQLTNLSQRSTVSTMSSNREVMECGTGGGRERVRKDTLYP